jgi:oligosaccharide repeat unit polymerase
MTFVYLFILGVTVLSAYYYRKDLFSPVRLYICLYCFLLAVNSLKLSEYQTEWSLTTHLFFWGASGLFIAGACIMLLVNRVHNPLGPVHFPFVKNGITADALRMDWKWFFYVWLFCSCVFLTSYGVSLLKSGAIPLFSPDADQVRKAFLGANLFANFGLFFGPLSLILAVELLLFSTLCRSRTIVVWVVSLASLLLYVTIITRLDLFRVVIFALVIYHYGKKNLSLAQLLYAFGFSIIFFLIFFFIRIKFDTFSVFAEAFRLHMPRGMLWAGNIYMYIANDFWNLDFAFRKYVDGTFSYPLGFGLHLFRPLLGLLGLETPLFHSYGFDSIMNESIIKVKGFNTVVYVWHFYKDFGAFGVYFLPLALGMLCTTFYINTLQRPSLFRLALWGTFVGFILLSYHAPLWELWFVYVNILFLAIAHKRITLATT